MKEPIYILLGSNLGERLKNLELGLGHLAQVESVKIIRSSGLYHSPAMEMSEPGPDFLNQVIEINTVLSPSQLLRELQDIEIKMGRTDKGNYKSRIIDLDILLFGRRIVETAALTIPQAGLLKRPFATIPLVAIAPDIVHPVTKKLISEYISVSDYNLVTLFEEHAAASH